MLKSIQKKIKQALVEFISNKYNLEYDKLTFQIPPNTELGELSTAAPFDLAKKVRRAPHTIAQEIASGIGPIEGISKIEAAGAGYVNFRLDRAKATKELYASIEAGHHGLHEEATEFNKVIVEHTNINPNKAAHIGHLRNAIIGDTFVRVLKFLGYTVEIQNYIDDTGVQLADVIVGLKHLNNMSVQSLEKLEARFDYYCWDLYAKVTEFYAHSPENLKLRAKILKEIEERDPQTAAMAVHVATRIMRAHLATMLRINVEYDLLPRESDILRLRFWAHAFELLKQKGVIEFSTKGKSAGCWVMKMETGERASAGENDEAADLASKDASRDNQDAKAELEEEKIIVRSDGTVTYVGKDIAYQLWKFGLLGLEFFYRPFQTYASGRTVWVTDSTANEPEAPRFGKADRVYNVIDTRQSYLQNIVAEGLRALGYVHQAANSIHFSYEMVALSPACAQALGIELSDADRKRAFVEVSGRKGLGVKADDLIDKLEESTLKEVKERHALSDEQAHSIAHLIAIGALRYFLVKFTRNSLIAFDFKEALSFEGETGPYIQYSVVRANNIFRRLAETGEAAETQVPAYAQEGDFAKFLNEHEDLWELVFLSARLSEVARQVVTTMELSHLAKYAFLLAQRFNVYYHKHHIISEPDKKKKLFLLLLTDIVRKQLGKALELMGIDVPERM